MYVMFNEYGITLGETAFTWSATTLTALLSMYLIGVPAAVRRLRSEYVNTSLRTVEDMEFPRKLGICILALLMPMGYALSNLFSVAILPVTIPVSLLNKALFAGLDPKNLAAFKPGDKVVILDCASVKEEGMRKEMPRTIPRAYTGKEFEVSGFRDSKYFNCVVYELKGLISANTDKPYAFHKTWLKKV